MTRAVPEDAPAATPGAGRAWLELARVSNAPTVVSNALAAATLGASAAGAASSMPGDRVAAAATGLVLIYTAGMVLNDVADAAIDRIERPSRPIPSGRVSRTAAAVVGLVLLMLGAAAAAWASEHSRWTAATLVVAVATYTIIHKRTRLAGVLVMGTCRGLAYLVAIGVAADPLELGWRLGPAAGVALYTVALSVVARMEMNPRRTSPWAKWMPMLCAVATVIAPGQPDEASLVVVSVLVAVHIVAAMGLEREGPEPKRRAVQLWIAGFCLIDAGVAAAVGRIDVAIGCVVCFVMTVWGQRRIAGT